MNTQLITEINELFFSEEKEGVFIPYPRWQIDREKVLELSGIWARIFNKSCYCGSKKEWKQKATEIQETIKLSSFIN